MLSKNSPFREGVQAYFEGVLINKNPYDFGSNSYQDWNRGWHYESLTKMNSETNPIKRPLIFSEYYSHDGCDCYKIIMPFSKYKETKLVLCKVSEGLEKAKVLAYKEILKRTMEVIESNDLDS